LLATYRAAVERWPGTRIREVQAAAVLYVFAVFFTAISFCPIPLPHPASLPVRRRSSFSTSRASGRNDAETCRAWPGFGASLR
jgi:hypothetical protein